MDLMLEAHGVGPPEQIPVNHDHIASAFEQRIRRQAILLLAIYNRVRRKEIPQVIVPPEREGEDVVNLELPTQRSSAPDTLFRAKSFVNSPGVNNIPFMSRTSQETIHDLAWFDHTSGNL